ncbi:hypothetical protein SpCBS45565_g04974 [Spizellomyces sp. 'palustris']|nr:hypothetical protein SpCBS45565_g04974 [Spizellomyces sp. 'palustris']
MTHYTPWIGQGACGFDAAGLLYPIEPPKEESQRYIVAVNHEQYMGSELCGACVEITGPTGATVTARMTDKCPGCSRGDLDVSPDTFAQLADPNVGKVQISWEIVPCPATSLNDMRYLVTEGSTVDWLEIRVEKPILPVVGLSVQTVESVKALERNAANGWVGVGLKLDGEQMDVKVDFVDGSSVIQTGIPISASSQGNLVAPKSAGTRQGGSGYVPDSVMRVTSTDPKARNCSASAGDGWSPPVTQQQNDGFTLRGRFLPFLLSMGALSVVLADAQ